MSATKPHPNLDLILSSIPSRSTGDLSAEIITWWLWSINVLKVWKNSSCVESFPAINWMSSIIKTSTDLNCCLNAIVSLNLKALINWYINFSAERYKTFLSGQLLLISKAIACSKWVLPRPTPPYKNKGLKETFLLSVILLAAAYASSLDGPTTKFSKDNLSSKGAPTELWSNNDSEAFTETPILSSWSFELPLLSVKSVEAISITTDFTSLNSLERIDKIRSR